MNEKTPAGSEEKFLDRLFGRLIAIGSIIYLDLSYACVKRLLQEGKVEFKAEKDEDPIPYTITCTEVFLSHDSAGTIACGMNSPRRAATPSNKRFSTPCRRLGATIFKDLYIEGDRRSAYADSPF
ncbi:MAG: hypothetical protein IPJ82_21055 [Lewinellaceae bacterium]|nr:hypothetical protein [Lewinellaceae bacterium]